MNQQGTETLQIASKFVQKTPKISNYEKLCEGIPFFEIGKILIRKQDRKIWNLGTMFSQPTKRSTRMLVSGIFKQLKSWCFKQVFEDREYFLLQMKVGEWGKIESNIHTTTGWRNFQK